MARIKGKDTKPELRVRSMLHKMGYRFRLHRRDLPGNPDLTLPRYKKVIFIHGCFWHGHEGCRRSKRPSTNVAFWTKKLDKNIKRDQRNIRELREMGWDTLIIWTCELKDEERLRKKIRNFFSE